jgi:hypothetical protein
MDYAKVVNGQVERVGLPTTGILKNGCTVSGYNLLTEDELFDEDWLPYIDNQPIYDIETQYLEFVDYTIIPNTEVIANYIVKTRVPQPPSEIDEIKDDALNIAEILLDLGIRIEMLEMGV